MAWPPTRIRCSLSIIDELTGGLWHLNLFKDCSRTPQTAETNKRHNKIEPAPRADAVSAETLFGIHSMKYEEFLFCTLSICSSTSFDNMRFGKIPPDSYHNGGLEYSALLQVHGFVLHMDVCRGWHVAIISVTSFEDMRPRKRPAAVR